MANTDGLAGHVPRGPDLRGDPVDFVSNFVSQISLRGPQKALEKGVLCNAYAILFNHCASSYFPGFPLYVHYWVLSILFSSQKK